MTPEYSSNRSIFRENAIKNLNAIDNVHVMLKVIKPSIWILIYILVFILLGIIIWGVMGKISLNVLATGIIIPAEQLHKAEKSLSESINDRKERLVDLKNLFDKKKKLYDAHYLTLVDLEKAKEEYVSAKEDLSNESRGSYSPNKNLLFYKSASDPNQLLDVLVFINHNDAKKIAVGMDAYILPNTVSFYDYGYIKGKVVSVSEYPVSKQSAYYYLGNMNLVDEFFSNSVPFVAKVELKKNNNNKSGLEWTTKLGAPYKIESGTSVSVKIVNRECTPLDLIMKKDKRDTL